ncbi:unannotated protein [freshwater metagenome]|uniref:Unannotated protein n=1 Tax=freshwater metagenome TaxID=449393 RepID=A0A6J5ZPR0_9ZZZZ
MDPSVAPFLTVIGGTGSDSMVKRCAAPAETAMPAESPVVSNPDDAVRRTLVVEFESAMLTPVSDRSDAVNVATPLTAFLVRVLDPLTRVPESPVFTTIDTDAEEFATLFPAES